MGLILKHQNTRPDPKTVTPKLNLTISKGTKRILTSAIEREKRENLLFEAIAKKEYSERRATLWGERY